MFITHLECRFHARQLCPSLRCRTHDVEKFPVYSPKAILAIGNLPDTLMNRSVVISMRRHLRNEVVARFRRRQASEQSTGTVSAITIWAERHKDEIAKAYLNQNLDFLKDREADIWEPLFAIASVAVPERLEELKRIAIRLSGEKASSDVDDTQGPDCWETSERYSERRNGRQCPQRSSSSSSRTSSITTGVTS